MADRSIVVRLRAEVAGFKREMAEATRAVDQTAKGTEAAAKTADTAMGRMVQSAKENQAAWNTAGTALTGFGAAALGGLALATKAAMDWESAWAGVVKTVDGTAPQMDALQAGLRGLARELPATHAEIAGVAEAAGQLGIAVPNILSFTRTMINMGEATNLTAEEAAKSLARFVNITGTSQNKIGLLGASIVGLGNEFATTESEILGMSMRLAGAGAQAQMSEGDILGIAAAMSSVGIEAEAGGSAMSQTMKRIGKAVDEGGDSLELFSQVSGMTAQEFSTAWKSDPTAALDAFISGLSGVEAQGMTTNGVLSELGITGIRESDSLLRLSAASEQGADGMSLLAEAVATGNAEFGKGTALIEEASKRYETAESRIQMARNALVDSAISIGGIVLPAVAELADGVAGLAGGFADLPGPVQGTVAALGGLAGAASLGAGAFLLLFPRVIDTVGAFREMGILSDSMAGKLGRATVTVGKAGLAFAALAAVPPILNAITDAARGIDNAELDLGMNQLTAGLLEAERTGRVFDSVLGDMYDSGALNRQMFSDLGSTISEVADRGAFQKFIGPLAATGVNDAAARLEELSDAFVLLSQTDLSKAQSTFAAFMDEAAESGATFEDVLSVMPTFHDELAGIATQMGLDGTDNAVLYKIAIGDIKPAAEDTTGALAGLEEGLDGAAAAASDAVSATDEYYDSLRTLADEFITAERAAMDYADSLDETAKAFEENGKHWEDGTEAADENKRALLDLAEQALATADSLSAEGKSGTFLQQAREDLIDVATEMTGSRELAEEYVDQLLGTPEEIETLVKLETEEANAKWTALWDELGYHPPLVIDPTVDPEDKLPRFSGLVSDIPPETNTSVGVETDEAIEKAYGFGEVIESETQDQTVGVDANIEPAVWEVNLLEAAIQESGGTVTINGDTIPGDQALDILMGIINSSDGTVTINGMPVPAEEALGQAIALINSSGGTVDIDANTSDAESKANHAARDRSSYISVSHNASSASSGIDNAARNRSSKIYVRYSVVGGTPQVNFGTGRVATARAGGGPIYGPGTGTSDSIPTLLSNGEHVLTAAEVALAGGQDSVYRMRSAIRAGALKFADGGGVESGGAVRPSAGANSWAWGSAPGGQGAAVVDSEAITSAMAAGMRGMSVALEINGRTLYGAVLDSGHAMRRPFVTRGG